MDDPLLALGLELAAQVADVDLEDVGVAAEVVVPHPLQDGRAGQDLARVLQEQGQQVELLAGQRDGPLAPDLVGGAVHAQVAEAQLGRAGAVAGPASARSFTRTSSSSKANGLTR